MVISLHGYLWLFLCSLSVLRFKSYITRQTIGECSLLLCFIENCHPFLTNQVMFVCVWGGGVGSVISGGVDTVSERRGCIIYLFLFSCRGGGQIERTRYT